MNLRIEKNEWDILENFKEWLLKQKGYDKLKQKHVYNYIIDLDKKMYKEIYNYKSLFSNNNIYELRATINKIIKNIETKYSENLLNYTRECLYLIKEFYNSINTETNYKSFCEEKSGDDKVYHEKNNLEYKNQSKDINSIFKDTNKEFVHFCNQFGLKELNKINEKHLKMFEKIYNYKEEEINEIKKIIWEINNKTEHLNNKDFDNKLNKLFLKEIARYEHKKTLNGGDGEEKACQKSNFTKGQNHKDYNQILKNVKELSEEKEDNKFNVTKIKKEKKGCKKELNKHKVKDIPQIISNQQLEKQINNIYAIEENKKKHIIEDLINKDIQKAKNTEDSKYKNKSKILYSCSKILGLDLMQKLLKKEIIHEKLQIYLGQLFDGNESVKAIFPLEKSIYWDEKKRWQFLLKTLYLLGDEYTLKLMETPDKTIKLSVDIINSINNFLTNSDIIKTISKDLSNIHKNNYEAKVRFLYPVLYEKKILSNDKIFYIKDFINYDYKNLNINSLYILSDVIKSLNIDIKGYIKNMVFSTIFKKNNKVEVKYYRILKERLKGKTLEEIGEAYGITRERVRQIINKVTINLYRMLGQKNEMNIIKAFSENFNYITKQDLEKIFKEYSDIVVYVLQEKSSLYNKKFNLLIYDNNWLNEIYSYRRRLPGWLFYNDRFLYIYPLQLILEEKGYYISKQIIEKILFYDYVRIGKILSKKKLTLRDRYAIVIEEYFSSGIYIYKEQEMKRFKKSYIDIFGEDKIQTSNRAIQGIISDVCINAGRGKYSIKRKRYISDGLLKKIYFYIKEHPYDTLPTSCVYYEFEDELKNEGIENRFFLHGILRQAYGDRLYFSRDYIYRTRSKFHFNKVLTKYVKDQRGIVSKEQIEKDFPKLSDIVLFTNLDDNVINLYGAFIHVDNIDISQDELNIIENIIKKAMEKSEIITIKDISPRIFVRLNALIERLKIILDIELFSYLEYWFKEKYEFKRPYIAKKGMEIPSKQQMILEFINQSDELFISEIIDFASQMKIQINSILEFINSLDAYVFKNRNEIISIEKAGFSEYSIGQIENYLLKNLNYKYYLLPEDINFRFLPCISLDWNEWLLYSLIRKWGREITVITNNAQFRASKPIFIKANKNIKTFEDFVEYIKIKKNYNDEEITLFMHKNKIF